MSKKSKRPGGRRTMKSHESAHSKSASHSSRPARTRTPTNELTEALTRFGHAQSTPYYTGPDYAGFLAWAGSWLPDASTTASIGPAYRIISSKQGEIVARYQALATVTKERSVPLQTINDSQPQFDVANGPPGWELQQYNEWTLLYRLFSGASTRFRELIRELQDPNPETNVPLTKLRSLSQFELRRLFFAAIHRGRERDALRILGALREDAHDPGEVDYLSALAGFFANEWEETIQFACRVQKDNPDYLNAQALLMEAFARRGDSKSLFALITASLDGDKEYTALSQFFIRYLAQCLVEDSENPEESFSEFVRFADSLPVVDPDWNDPYESELTHNSFRLATSNLERILERDSRDQALQQIEATDVEPSEAYGEEDITLRDLQLTLALAIDVRFYIATTEGDFDSRTQTLIQRLMNPPRNAKFVDYMLALDAQWRLGSRDSYFQNILSAVDQLPHELPEQMWGLLLRGYQYGIASNAPEVSMLEKHLENWERFRELREATQRDALVDHVCQRLTPMGRLSYGSAKIDLEQATARGETWKDAGMISLGFFRTLELELNDRLLKPALRNLGAERINKMLDQFIKLRIADSAHPPQSNKRKKAVQVWERMHKPLVALAGGSSAGLDLGSTEFFLGKLTTASGDDADVKKVFRDAIREYLTERGFRALEDNQFVRLVNSEVRERFRNPPAHTRYLPLQTALECRQHVDKSLLCLNEWLRM